jgi:3-oxoacyl-[acyl-carrier-protein] synthase III
MEHRAIPPSMTSSDARGNQMSFGIVALGHALGEELAVMDVAPQYTDELRKVAGWGFRGFHRAHDSTGLTDLAEQAGRLALERAGLAADELDLVVLAMTDIAEYLYWDAAAAIQARLGAHRAEALLVNQACGSGVLALDAAAGKFATRPEYRTALVVGANRVCDAYWNRMESTTAITSDGAAAAVLARGHEGRRFLSAAVISDGRYADFFRLETGGTARPFGSDGCVPDRVASPYDRLEEFFGDDHRAMLDFADTVLRREREVFEVACARAGVQSDRVRRVIHLNDNRKALADLASELGLPLERTNAELAMAHGHLGCADQLFCLEQHLEAGEIGPGDLVALMSTGSGMHWVCALLRI